MRLRLIILGAIFQGTANALVGLTVRPSAIFLFLGCAFLIASVVGALLRASDRAPASPIRLVDCLWLNVATAVTFGAFYLALIWIPASLAAGAEAAAAPLAALSINAFRTGRVRYRLWIMAIVVFVVSIAFGWSQNVAGATSSGIGTVVGMALGILAGLGLAVLATLSRRLAETGVSASSILAVRYHATYVLAFICAAVNWQHYPSPAEVGSLLLWFGPLGFAAIALPLVLIQAGMMKTSPVLTSVIMAAAPGFSFITESIINPATTTLTSILLLAGLVLAVVCFGLVEAYSSKTRVHRLSKEPNPTYNLD